jgi:hypothetical protein
MRGSVKDLRSSVVGFNANGTSQDDGCVIEVVRMAVNLIAFGLQSHWPDEDIS